MDMPLLKRIVEAALLAASQPMGTKQLAELFPEGEAPSHQILQQALESLAGDCEGRGVELVEVASGYRYQVRGEVYPWVSRLWTERQTRYGRAVLETLALIAYRQPITRGEIESVRGVAVSTNIIRTLEERDWIRVVGHRDVPGKPALLGTTRGFLDYFGLKSLDQLPPLAELRDIPDLEPELPFDGDKAPAWPTWPPARTPRPMTAKTRAPTPAPTPKAPSRRRTPPPRKKPPRPSTMTTPGRSRTIHE
ncbi:SMC-Scp complex subunit ScpB [Alkalisalibacterium limincola]|uniref:SMC-Scp complex subunit ScpB n=1 Tax=Alkalisalibacterium limincola TaxID=2699169 RepID=A0A5C8KH60_9GAMM|nr:SMC-Scp complex subunit ScpB [Alkalisalibacterium limincola]TXK59671.1 SMC-Scp complex subunit ScpB [Alkalisalibacterium limincola]